MTRPPIHSFHHEPDRWRARLEINLPTENQIRRMHKAKLWRIIKAQRDQVCWTFRLTRHKPPPGPWLVTLTRCGHSKMDDDGVVGAFKAIRDQVADELGIDDGHADITFRCEQSTIKRNSAPWIEIDITTREAC